MNGKALIIRATDIQNYVVDDVENTRISLDVVYISSQNSFKRVENIDAFFLPGDTVAQIKTKVRNTVIAKGAEFGMTVATADVGSIMQI